MMRISGFLFSMVLLAAMYSACTGKAEERETETPIVEPDPAELALLMKDMHRDAKSWRDALLSDSLSLDSIDIYLKMVHSTPTDSTVGGPVFEGFAAHYQSAFDRLVAAVEAGEARPAFNDLVKSCVTCHQTYCPGPVKTIEKLYVPVP